MSKAGFLKIAADLNGNPTSIIQAIDVSDCQFFEVAAEFTASEGEGDQSLGLWRTAHWNFYPLNVKNKGYSQVMAWF